MAVVEKSIVLSVIVPTMHGVVYWDAALPVVFPASIYHETCQKQTSERAGERANERSLWTTERIDVSLFVSFSLSLSFAPSLPPAVLIAQIIFLDDRVRARYCQRNRSRCSWESRAEGKIE